MVPKIEMTLVSCHIDESKLVCSIQSIVGLPSIEHRLVLNGVLSCPIPKETTTELARDDIGCSCEGMFPSIIHEPANSDTLDDDRIHEISSCRCYICEESVDSTIFSWECDHPVAGDCWGFDCQGGCKIDPFSSLDSWSGNSKETRPRSNNAPTNNHLSFRTPTNSPLESSVPSPVLPHRSPVSSGPPTVAIAARSASLLWILTFMTITQNSTDIWPTTPDTRIQFL